MSEKICTICKENKPVEEFSKRSSNKDGFSHCCKSCFNDKYNKNVYHKYKAVEGNRVGFKKDKYEREILLKQIAKIRDREANEITRSRANYGFLFTNEKFWR